MIKATIRIGDGSIETIDNPVTMPAVPPIGGHIIIIDRNSNHQVLYVDDVVIGAVSDRMLAELPNTSQWRLRITILCSETFDHELRLR